MALVEAELGARRAAGAYAGKFAGLAHYFGYEGRCALPTNFDATCGRVAGAPAARAALPAGRCVQASCCRGASGRGGAGELGRRRTLGHTAIAGTAPG